MDVVQIFLLPALFGVALVLPPRYLGKKAGVLTIKLFSPAQAEFKTPPWHGWIEFIFFMGIVVVTTLSFSALGIPILLPLPGWFILPGFPFPFFSGYSLFSCQFCNYNSPRIQI